MRRNLTWALSTLSALVLLLGYHTSFAGAGAAAGPPATSESGTYSATLGSGTTSTPAAGSGGGDEPAPSPSTGSSATARTVVGDVAQTQWGPVQVQLTVAAKKITRVSVLQYPDGNPRDQQINADALPRLTQETIDAQSASIDMVSGATVTSDGYLQSLQSALDRAGL